LLVSRVAEPARLGRGSRRRREGGRDLRRGEDRKGKPREKRCDFGHLLCRVPSREVEGHQGAVHIRASDGMGKPSAWRRELARPRRGVDAIERTEPIDEPPLFRHLRRGAGIGDPGARVRCDRAAGAPARAIGGARTPLGSQPRARCSACSTRKRVFLLPGRFCAAIFEGPRLSLSALSTLDSRLSTAAPTRPWSWKTL